MKLSELLVDGRGYKIDLAKLVGVQIDRVEGYLTNEFGEPTFQLTDIWFVDGSHCYVEGEHDCPYLSPDDAVPNMDDDTLSDLYAQQET